MKLRDAALNNTLFVASDLLAALYQMRFVQADPIRSPARAQDLILRHRVPGYRAGDLERHYPSLELDEGYLYAYGFLPKTDAQLLYPKADSKISAFEKKVLAFVKDLGAAHPRKLDEHFGQKRVVNAWGGFSKQTTQALENLHHRGFLRVARRDNGIRVYEVTQEHEPISPLERLKQLIQITVNVLAPISERTLMSLHARRQKWMAPKHTLRSIIDAMVKAGQFENFVADNQTYLVCAESGQSKQVNDAQSSQLKFLAPFDPLVWDRKRFEHIWGWSYRFEAYTPVAKRIRGYYAMPLLWRKNIIGWANVKQSGGPIDVDLGFVKSRPRDKEFSRALDEEIAALELFLRG